MTLAHTCVYLVRHLKTEKRTLCDSELGRIIVMLMFIADSFVHDVALELGDWHRVLFSNVCHLRTLNKIVIMLLEGQNFFLRVEYSELDAKYRSLLCVSRCVPL